MLSGKREGRGIYEPLPQFESHRTVVVNFDETQNWAGMTGTNGTTPRVLQGQGLGFKANDIAFYSNEQWLKLYQTFNEYTQFRVRNITVTWVPRFKNAAAMTAWVYTKNQTGSGITAAEIQTVVDFYGAQSEIALIPDAEDLGTRETLEEYWQIRAHPQAATGSVYDTIRISMAPTVMEVTNYTVLNSNQNDAANAAYVNNTAQLPSTTGPVHTTAQDAPVLMPWQATRVTRQTGSGSTDLVSNTGKVLWGMKQYFYTPFNEAVATSGNQATVGMFTYQYVFEFRNLETRSIINTYGLTEEEKNLKDLAVLRELHGEKWVMQSHRVKAHFKTTIADTSEAMNRHEPMGQITIQGKRPRPNESTEHPPAQSSQHTPSAQTARTPLARLGLVRNG